jgi:hypothetical protein
VAQASGLLARSLTLFEKLRGGRQPKEGRFSIALRMDMERGIHGIFPEFSMKLPFVVPS